MRLRRTTSPRLSNESSVLRQRNIAPTSIAANLLPSNSDCTRQGLAPGDNVFHDRWSEQKEILKNAHLRYDMLRKAM
jgi:hypothetical protein